MAETAVATTEGLGFDNVSAFRKIESIRKRDGRLAPFDLDKIVAAVSAAMQASNEGTEEDARFVARSVQSAFQRASLLVGGENIIPTVEKVQDAVERELMLHGFTTVAKHYILYREERARSRRADATVPQHVKELVEASKGHFPNSLAEFVYYRTYSRWIEAEQRRETWLETVDRYMAFMKAQLGPGKLTDPEYTEIREAILDMEVMPSMRLMWSAGPAAERTHVAAFNCAFIAPSKLSDFAEILYILSCGTGVGFAVESRNVQQLPIIAKWRGTKLPVYVVEDSKEGWGDALTHGLKAWYCGDDVEFDVSGLRPLGARLKTMGGRSSGPQPLVDLLAYVRSVVKKRQGKRLTCLDVHDIVCKVADAIVVGGVRRSALISLSDLDDEEMRHAKEGHFHVTHPHRQVANNSAVYDEKPTAEVFLREWLALVESHSGERGIFNRRGLLEQIPTRRIKKWEEMGNIVQGQIVAQPGTNPCGEINLLSKQFCNLTEVICRLGDTREDLLRKVRIAAILGTYQATLTNYPYLSPEWASNCKTERLLGVSLTGLWDCEEARNPDVLSDLRTRAVEVNREIASRFGIPESTAVTCIKPSGTVSQLTDTSSGMHPRYAPYYIRRVQITSSDPLFKMLKDQGLPYFPVTGQTYDTATTFVFEFPVKSPDGVKVFSTDPVAYSAKVQLDFWKRVKEHYTEHNPSVTVTIGEDEWVDVSHWIWKNWDIIGGLAFLPRDDHVYPLAPFEAITKERYEEMMKKFEHIDYARILTYEREDETQGARELACVSGVCEI